MTKFCFAGPTVGNDPEFLVLSKEGRVIPAEELGLPLSDAPGKHEVVADNVAIELHPEAGYCLNGRNSALGNAIVTSMYRIKQKLYPTLSYKDALDKFVSEYKLSVRPVEEIQRDDLKYRSVSQFGCHPSMVCKEGKVSISTPKMSAIETLYRSVGYHVHLGMSDPKYYIDNGFEEGYQIASKMVKTPQGRVKLVQMCDLLVGLPSVLLENDDRVALRRSFLGYGQAGEFREQPHGFEYRTIGAWPLISNSWTWWVNSSVRDALFLVANGLEKPFIENTNWKAVADAINTGDVKAAVKLWTSVKTLLYPIIFELHKTIPDTVHHKCAVLSLNMLKTFEHIVSKGGLKFAKETGEFDIRTWLHPVMDGYSFNWNSAGFSSSTQALRESAEFAKFSNDWTPETLEKI